jgi:hypothetical protein
MMLVGGGERPAMMWWAVCESQSDISYRKYSPIIPFSSTSDEGIDMILTSESVCSGE